MCVSSCGVRGLSSQGCGCRRVLQKSLQAVLEVLYRVLRKRLCDGQDVAIGPDQKRTAVGQTHPFGAVTLHVVVPALYQAMNVRAQLMAVPTKLA